MKRQVSECDATTNFDSTVRVHKRSRLSYKVLDADTKLIKPFMVFKDNLGGVQVPSIDIQNLISEHLDRHDRQYGPGNHVKARMVEQHGHPFFQTVCDTCETPHYTYMFTTNKRHIDKVTSRCSACRNRADRDRHKLDYTPIQKLMIMDIVNDMLDEAWAIDGFNERRYRPQFKRVLNSGHRRVVDMVLERGVTYQHVCNRCGDGFYLYEAHIDPKTKMGIRPGCKSCSLRHQNQANTKGISMNFRFKECGMDGYQVIQDRLRLQQSLCYYTFIPMTDTRYSPWMYSPERLDRTKGYSAEGNVVLCCSVFNIGGEYDFSHKLVLQLYFAGSFPVFYDQYLRRPPWRFIVQKCNHCKGSAKKRKQTAGREDRSFLFDIDADYLNWLAISQGYRCAISNIPLVFERHHPWLASLDRIDPSQGYIRGNVRWVVNRFNGKCTWTSSMVKTLETTLDKTIHKVWDAHYGSDGPEYGKYLLNLAERAPNPRFQFIKTLLQPNNNRTQAW
jgi:hypothetical protein